MASVLWHLSSVFLWPYFRMMRRYCREAGAVCAQSHAFADYARRFGAGGEIPVFYLGAEPPHRCGAPERRSCGPPLLSEQEGNTIGQQRTLETGKSQSPLRLLYLGSMGQVYDLRTLVEAVLQLREQGSDVRLDLVGEGEQRAALERQVRDAGQEACIRFHGFLSGSDLKAVMTRADAGIIPMHPASQVAVPYKAADYLSAGLAVVNSLPGELKSKLSGYGCGRSYQAGDPESLVEALRPWLEDSSKLDAAKSGARRLFGAEFDAKKIYRAYAEWLTAHEKTQHSMSGDKQ